MKRRLKKDLGFMIYQGLFPRVIYLNLHYPNYERLSFSPTKFFDHGLWDSKKILNIFFALSSSRLKLYNIDFIHYSTKISLVINTIKMLSLVVTSKTYNSLVTTSYNR